MTKNIKFFSKTAIFLAIFTILSTNSTFAKQNPQNDDFFGDDIFKEMELMHQKMENLFAEHNKKMQKFFEKAQKTDNNIEILTKNDENHYFYELSYKGYKKDEISVVLKDDILSFIGQKTDKKGEKSFNYSFLLPNYDKSVQPEIDRSEGKIVVKLKRKS